MGKISFSVITIGTISVLLTGFYSRSQTQKNPVQKNPVQKNPENSKILAKNTTTEPIIKPCSPNSPRIILMKVTAYCPCEKCCGKFADGSTSTGKNAWETDGVAADPKLLPYNTKLVIPGVGIRIVDDTGGAMQKSAEKGIYHIDLRFRLPDGIEICPEEIKKCHQRAVDFGRQCLEVKILNGEENL